MQDDAQLAAPHGNVKTVEQEIDAFFYRTYMEKGEEVPCTLLAIGMICVLAHQIFLVLIRQTILKESHMLEFTGIRNAHAANLDDEQKLLTQMDPERDHVEFLIDMLRTIGRYNKDIRENVKLGLGWKLSREGPKRRRALTAVIAWQFWWIADLAGHRYIGAVIVLCTAMCSLVLYLLQKFGDRATFAVEVFFWFGFAFVYLSNWPSFWKEEFVQARTMSKSTAWLQVVMIFVTLFVCYLFYSGQLKPFLWKMDDWKRHLEQHRMVSRVQRHRSLQAQTAQYALLPATRIEPCPPSP